jgi:hypothetical protein
LTSNTALTSAANSSKLAPIESTNASPTKLEGRSSFGDDPSLLEGVDKWRTTAAAKPLLRLWVRPTFGEDNERSEVGSPEPTLKNPRVYIPNNIFVEPPLIHSAYNGFTIIIVV